MRAQNWVLRQLVGEQISNLRNVTTLPTNIVNDEAVDN